MYRDDEFDTKTVISKNLISIRLEFGGWTERKCSKWENPTMGVMLYYILKYLDSHSRHKMSLFHLKKSVF